MGSGMPWRLAEEGWHGASLGKVSQQAEDEGSTEALRQEETGKWESDLIVLAWETNGFGQQSNLI